MQKHMSICGCYTFLEKILPTLFFQGMANCSVVVFDTNCFCIRFNIMSLERVHRSWANDKIIKKCHFCKF